MTFVDLMLELWIPIFLPPLFTGVSWFSFWIWLILVEFDGVHSHAAFDFGFPLPSPTRHWLHHHLLTSNYSNGLLDAIWDTEAKKRPIESVDVLPKLLGRRMSAPTATEKAKLRSCSPMTVATDNTPETSM